MLSAANFTGSLQRSDRRSRMSRDSLSIRREAADGNRVRLSRLLGAKLGFARQGGLQATSMRRLSRSAGIFCISRPLGDGPKAVDVHSSLRTRARASLKVAKCFGYQ